MNTKRILFTALISCLAFSTTLLGQETQKINEVLEQKRVYNKENPTGIGYRIQLYNGNEIRAYKIKNEFQVEFKLKATLLYESPEWKVRVGNYKTRLEADRALLEISKKFSSAVVLETEIEL
ncbi:MAG: SPOR domain-containing protein [Urechidicola sp.]|nr:SPOR domain-containing protein [Urechidicola sp.]